MSNSLFGFHSQSLLSRSQWGELPSQDVWAQVRFYGQNEKIAKDDFKQIPMDWQKPSHPFLLHKYASARGPVWWVHLDLPAQKEHQGQFQVSSFAAARDAMGALFREIGVFEKIHIEYCGKDREEFLGLVCGIEISQYRFKNYWPKKNTDSRQVVFLAKKLKDAKKVLDEGKHLGESVNLARHLVNLPPNVLNPQTYMEFTRELFKNSPCKVEVWNDEKLKKENHHLHVAVGQASQTPSCLVKISYRQSSLKKHYSFVGKGITFDSGGLDIKPASGMRDMKKDMGGSASVLGLAYWMSVAKPKINADFYLALAENSVSDNAFRPGDVYQTRHKKTVEIHNTDAEGRLVLCDTLSLAAESKPEWIVDIATLTGAIKVALGETTPGLFCNQDQLAKKLLESSQKTGDNCWRMPLDPAQRYKLKSDVADLVNAHEGFGGAVTAALFLEEFVSKTPWAHFDIYSWIGSPSGAFSEKGGSGQLVQSLVRLCQEL